MNQTQAIAKLRKVIGKSFGYRVDNTALNAEQREVQRAIWSEAKRAAEEAEAMRVARLNELLQDPAYQALKANAKAAKDAQDKASRGLYRKRISVGSVNSLFFSVRAEGDNWSEVVEKVCNKTGEAAQ